MENLVSWLETDTEPFSSMVERSHVTTKDAGSTPVMVPKMNKEEEIRAIANRIWLEAGSPDGELLVLYYGKMVKVKDIHWKIAEIEWTYGPDYFRSF